MESQFLDTNSMDASNGKNNLTLGYCVSAKIENSHEAPAAVGGCLKMAPCDQFELKQRGMSINTRCAPKRGPEQSGHSSETILNSAPSMAHHNVLMETEQDFMPSPLYASVPPPLVDTNKADKHVLMDHLLRDTRNLAIFTARSIYHLFDARHENEPGFIAYLDTLYQATEVPLTVVMYALQYLDRVYKAYPKLGLPIPECKGIMTGMYTTALILANHFLEDHAYSNKTWSDVTGIEYRLVNSTQRQFLALLDHRLHINRMQYVAWTDTLYEVCCGMVTEQIRFEAQSLKAVAGVETAACEQARAVKKRRVQYVEPLVWKN